MSIEQEVAKHYGREGLAEIILARARQHAANPDALTTADLAMFDDMHIGGRCATAHLFGALGFTPGMRVLDIGCGIGGAARYAVGHYAVEVTGIDLTPGYKEVAEALCLAVGLDERLEFVTGSALDMPFPGNRFHAAYTIHAGMNIQEKEKFYSEVFRVIKPGGLFGIYDILAGQTVEDLHFPVPWAESQGTSFMVTERALEDLLTDAGFEIVESEDRHEFALEVLRKLKSHPSFSGRNDEYRHQLQNLITNIENGYCGPWQMICRKTQPFNQETKQYFP